jgi:beta-lactamase regulating signal transducer with metallopeptidase domain
MTLLLLNTTLKISLIVLAALLAIGSMRRRSAATRHFVLAVALACAAATPLLRLVAPAWQPASPMQIIDRPLAVFDDPGSDASGVAAAAPNRATAVASPLRVLGTIWMVGAAVSMLVLVVGFARLRWLASRAVPLLHGPWAQAAAEIARVYGLRQSPLVLHSDHQAALGTWGWRRPKILVPVDAPSWPLERIRIVLGHELAHVRRRDWIVQTAADCICAVYWFNPLVWLASRRLRLESEQACDDAVLALGVEGEAYASELVDLARACRPASLLLVPTATIARPSSLERRVRAMLNVTVNRDPLTRSVSVAAALALAVITVLVAGFGVSAQAQFGSVSGTVTDQNGRTIQGVTLVLSNTQAQTKHQVKSDAAGVYEFVGVPSAVYELTFELPGMSTLKREGLSVSGGQGVTVNAVMRIGTLEETITVTRGASDRPAVIDYTGARATEKPDPCAASAAGGCVRPPRKIKHVSPLYPAGSAGGNVELKAVIDATGRVSTVDVIGTRDGRPADPALAEAATTAVREWEFLPTHLDGDPIEVTMNVHIAFARE